MSPRDKPGRESAKRRARETKAASSTREDGSAGVHEDLAAALAEPTPKNRAGTGRASRRKDASGGKPVTSRRSQYLISARSVPGIAPIALEQVEQRLKDIPEVHIVNVIAPRGAQRIEAGAQRVIVARIPDQTAQSLAQSAGPQLLIERDHALTFPAETVPLCADPGIALMQPDGDFSLTVTVTGKDGPVEGAQVYAFGSQWPARGITDSDGRVELAMGSESSETIQGLFVRPQSDYWSQWIPSPEIQEDGETSVTLTALSESIPQFPNTGSLGWGLRAMKVDQLPPNFRGQGIKIGLIDSGVAATHNSLKHCAKDGLDLTTDDRGNGWKQDSVGHGSLCAGILAGSDTDGTRPRGCAPDAELVVCKVYPGRYSDLLQALDYCIERQVDIINLNLGGPEPSELIEQRLIKARMLGITCIAAAGDSSTPIQGLAASPNVLAVSAIGHVGEFPANSYHAQTIPSMISPEGYFVARFSSFGPQVGVCAPGVAVISSVPPNNFGVGDGTPLAAAHVAGLAALLLAHHPEFQGAGMPQVRNPQRVERLLQLIRQSAVPLQAGDFTHTGFGLPNAVRAFVPETVLPVHTFGGVPAVLSAFSPAAGAGSIGTVAGPMAPVSVPVVSPTPWPFGVPARPAATSAIRSVPPDILSWLLRAA